MFEKGHYVAAGGELSLIESVQAASNIYASVSSQVIAIITQLEEAPDIINEFPMSKGWIVKIKLLELK
ncbi:MAG: hypothetical protein PUP46_05540 [Endozoicomonas sp. (ex Botrylloides leachii)]|nr:hypothetical protein [Endozoicomonas sp. (ex Botrylloides leachii)]